MTDINQFSLNNVRVKLSDIPPTFSKTLKSFITRQPDFNDAIHALFERQQKIILILQQQISQMNDSSEELTQQVSSLSKSNSELLQSLKLMEQKVQGLQQPIITVTTEE